MKISKVEKLLKSKVRSENARRAKNKKAGYLHNVDPVSWTDTLAMHYQSRNKQFKGCNGKCRFIPETTRAYSYNHWRFVDRIKGKVVFNAYRYSVTTSGHQSTVRQLLKELGIKIDLEVNTRQDLTNFNFAVLPEMYQRLFETEIAMARKGSKPESNIVRKREVAKLKRDIKLARKLGAKLDQSSIDNIKLQVQTRETKRLEQMAHERKAKSMQDKAARQLANSGQVFSGF